jgi:LPXTG-motif cell wall-anchored protein
LGPRTGDDAGHELAVAGMALTIATAVVVRRRRTSGIDADSR